MKIIAQTGTGYLLEADINEVALLCGFRSQYDDGMKRINVSVGLEMNLIKMARTSEFLRTLDEDKLKKLKEQLRFIQDDLEETSATINAITVFETLKDEIK